MSRTTLVAVAVLGLAALGFAVLGSATVHADPVQPDRNQPANGIPAPGYPEAPVLTPALSPIQLPAPDITTSDGTTAITAYPFLSPWVHNVVPIAENTAVELRGAVQLTVPDQRTGGQLIVNPNGHCLFAGNGFAESGATATNLTPIAVDTSVFALTIEPTLLQN